MAVETKNYIVMDEGNGNFFRETTTAPAVLHRAVCSDANRPAASSWPVGLPIWNTDDNAVNYSDGTNWRSAIGELT